MVTKNPQSAITAEKLAASVLDTTPLIMYFIRRNNRRKNKSSQSIAQIRALAVLKNCPGASLVQVAESLSITSASASALVEKLVQSGLVAREDDPKERRRIVLSVTGEGAKRLEAVRALVISDIAALLSNLPESKLARANEGLALLRDIFHQANSRMGT